MALRRHAPALAGFAVLTLAVLWPAVARFRSQPLVDSADGSVFRWAWWWMPRALGDGHNPFTTDAMFHPIGADLAMTTTAPLVSVVTWPVQAVLGGTAQVNFVQLAAMFLSGAGAYLLADHVCGDRRASLLAGVAYALFPHRFVDVSAGHLNLVHLGVVPIGLLVLLRFLERPERGRALVLGAVAGATFLIEPQLTVLFLFAAVPLAVEHRRQMAAAWRELMAAGALAILVAAPLLVPMAAALASGDAGEPAATRDSLIYSASPLSWVVPPLDRLWIGHAADLAPLTRTIEGVAYPGILVVGLAIAGSRLGIRQQRRGWVAMTVTGIVLSLGPYPFVRDTYVEMPLPFFLVRAVPGLDAFRVPGRFAVIGALGLAVLAASALAELSRRHPRRSRVVIAGVCVLTTVELLPRLLPESPSDAPEPYHAIADDPHGGAVLEIPVQWSTGQDAIGYEGGREEDFLFLVNAIAHGRPTVSGAASRYPADRLEKLLEDPLRRQLLALQDEPGFDDAVTFDHVDLQQAGIGYVAYDREEPVPRALAHIRGLGLTVLADDGSVIVWRVRD
jgi:hypothetical protein